MDTPAAVKAGGLIWTQTRQPKGHYVAQDEQGKRYCWTLAMLREWYDVEAVEPIGAA